MAIQEISWKPKTLPKLMFQLGSFCEFKSSSADRSLALGGSSTFTPNVTKARKEVLEVQTLTSVIRFTRNHAAMQLQDSPNQLDFISIIWVWVNTYRYIFSGMNIHYQLFWGSLGTRVLTHPHFIRWFTMIFSLLVTVQQHTRPPPQAWRWGSSLTFPRGHDGTRNRIPGSMDVIVPS